MLKSEITNTLKSMGQPKVPCMGLSKPILGSMVEIDAKEQHQRLTSKINGKDLTPRSTAMPRQISITGSTKIDKINVENFLDFPYSCPLFNKCWIQHKH